DPLRQAAQHQVARDAESLIEVNRRDDRFERIGEDRLLPATTRRVLALAEEERRPEVELERQLREHPRVDDSGAHFRELSFGKPGDILEDVVRDDETEDGVSEEL